MDWELLVASPPQKIVLCDYTLLYRWGGNGQAKAPTAQEANFNVDNMRSVDEGVLSRGEAPLILPPSQSSDATHRFHCAVPGIRTRLEVEESLTTGVGGHCDN